MYLFGKIIYMIIRLIIYLDRKMNKWIDNQINCKNFLLVLYFLDEIN